MNREQFIKPLINTALTGALIYVASNAFSRKVRKQMIRRDGNCVERNELCLGQLEAAHYIHDRDDPDYNTLDAGRILCSFHHGIDHELSEGQNGLSTQANRYALLSIAGRLLTFMSSGHKSEHEEFVLKHRGTLEK